MTLSATLSAKQVAAGQPIALQGQLFSADSADFASWSSYGFGTTTTSTPPAVFTDLSHYDSCSSTTDSFPDAAQELDLFKWGAGAQYALTDTITVQSLKRLDSNYAAGHYVWFVAFATASGSNPVVAASTGYLVR